VANVERMLHAVWTLLDSVSVHAVRVHGADDDHRQLYSAGAGGTSAGERQDTANTTTRT